jgi:glutathione S-transferase
MPFEFVELDEAKKRDGLRMVVVPGIPSPWGEAAKGILHVKKIPWVAVRLDAGSDEMFAWTGERSAPVAVYNDDVPRSGWAEILLLAERIEPSPALVPEDPADRALAFGLAREICGEMGLAWCRRNAGVHSGMNGQPGFPKPIAEYLGPKYGYRAEEGELYERRVVEILGLLSNQLAAHKAAGSRYYIGERLSVVDIYSATFMTMFRPMPHDLCPMPEMLRETFEVRSPQEEKALQPALIEHRDFVYREYLELPLTL